MKFETARKILVKDAEFLGITLGELLEDMRKNTGPYPISVVTAFRVYEELAYV